LQHILELSCEIDCLELSCEIDRYENVRDFYAIVAWLRATYNVQQTTVLVTRFRVFIVQLSLFRQHYSIEFHNFHSIFYFGKVVS